MRITIELTADLDRRVREAAASRGVTPEAYAREVLELVLDPPEPPPVCGTPRVEAALRRFREWATRRREDDR